MKKQWWWSSSAEAHRLGRNIDLVDAIVDQQRLASCMVAQMREDGIEVNQSIVVHYIDLYGTVPMAVVKNGVRQQMPAAEVFLRRDYEWCVDI